MSIMREVLNLNGKTNLEILENLNLTKRVQIWFQTITNSNFATPFKFENAQTCKLCKETRCEITHLALNCSSLVTMREKFIAQTLASLKNQEMIELFDKKLLKIKIQKINMRNKKSKRYSNSAIDENFFVEFLDDDNETSKTTEIDTQIMIELLGVGILRNPELTKKFLDYLWKIEERFVKQKIQKSPQHINIKDKNKPIENNEKRDPMEID